MSRTVFSTRRLLGWLPAAVFLAITLLSFLGASRTRDRLIFLVFSVVVFVYLVRCLRVAVITNEDEIIIRGALWTHRYRFRDIERGELVPMPWAGAYVKLALGFRDGRVKRFEDVSAADSRKAKLLKIVDHINERVGSQSD